MTGLRSGRKVMTPLQEQEILRLVGQAKSLYNRLVLVVGPCGSGKTTVLNRLAEAKGWPFVKLNLELARMLLELTERQRPLQAQKLLNNLLDAITGEVLVLDNTEILFDTSLKLDPLRLLQSLSRDRTLVVGWNGSLREGQITFSLPDHPEFKRYPAPELLLVELGQPDACEDF
ncbi:MAG: BREX-3 system P-loop-containing protein BrxF [Magnetococcales bacterium]|nr:BREX-3 system P-loop-containing protein BrxF [Magnetococcales bacterium]